MLLLLLTTIFSTASGFCTPPQPASTIASNMKTYNRQRQHRKALAIFAAWASKNSSPNSPDAAIAWEQAITAHGRLGTGDKALDCFQRMQAAGFPSSLGAYTAAIRACASRKLWPVALSLLDDLRADGLKADTVVYNADGHTCSLV